MSVKGTIFNIQRFSVHDGPGIRTTVFMQGCPLDCWWCHNPEGRPFGLGKQNGNTTAKEHSVDELMDVILKDRIFYDESGGGVTFSGGEPMSQPLFLEEILEQCNVSGIHTAVDTSGYTQKQNFDKIIPFTDLFLFDFKIMNGGLHKKFTDVENENILQNFRFLLEKAKKIIVRIPLIPDITSTDQNVMDVIEFLSCQKSRPEINILPFHRIAEGKYAKNGFTNRMIGKIELPESRLDEVAYLFKKWGFRVRIG